MGRLVVVSNRVVGPADAHTVPVQGDEGRSIHDEADAASVELSDRNTRRLHAHDDPLVCGSGGSRADLCGD